MRHIAMRVDLSCFFSDARRNTLIYIDASWENINDVQDHIQKLFRLSNISLMTQDGCYLPAKESIQVLNSVESLKAFKLNENELQDASSIRLSIAETSKKRKNRSKEMDMELSTSTPHNPKRSKGEDDSNKEQSTLKADSSNERRSTRQSAKKYSEQQAGTLEETEASEELEMSDNCFKTVRSSLRAANNSKSHIIYEEATTEQLPTVEPIVPDAEFRSQLTEENSSSARRFKLPRKATPVQILEEIVIPPPAKTAQENGNDAVEPLEAQVAEEVEAEVPVAAADQEIIEVEKAEVSQDKPSSESTAIVAEQSLLESDSEDDVMVLDDTNLDDSTSADIIADMLQSTAVLTALPTVGDNIIFKLTRTKGASELSAKTEDIAGTCSYVNRRTKSITISVIACGVTTRRVLRQYCNNLDDSNDSALVISVNFRDLIEPRLIVSSVD